MQIEVYRSGQELAAHQDELARLRIQIFFEFPYLYEGTLEYERSYLKPYLTSPASLLVLVRDGERVVGASTAIPLLHEVDDLLRPWKEHHPENYLYLGESVLLPDYRGRGLGHRFFSEREAHARSLGYPACCFCAVNRPDDHPLRPPDYRPLDAFWKRRGYRPRADLECRFRWQDRGETTETAKAMTFWERAL